MWKKKVIEFLTGFCPCKSTIFVKNTKFRRSPLHNHQANPRNITSSTARHPTKLKDIVGHPPSYHCPIALCPPISGAWSFSSGCSRMVKSSQIRTMNASRRKMVNCRTTGASSPPRLSTIPKIMIFLTILLVNQVVKSLQKQLQRRVKMQSNYYSYLFHYFYRLRN